MRLCVRRQGRYPKAADLYARMLNDFPAGQFREPAVQHMFEIANFWLDETREEMEEYREKKEGKRFLVLPTSYFHLSKDRPFYDIGQATERVAA